jgi:ribosome biogenesis GTPase
LAETCRFQDCRHDREPDCAVQAALQTGALPSFRYRLFQDLQTQHAAHKKRFFT